MKRKPLVPSLRSAQRRVCESSTPAGRTSGRLDGISASEAPNAARNACCRRNSAWLAARSPASPMGAPKSYPSLGMSFG
ncbi:hypothetical protein [Paractinoplanes durhamensis]|uniref:hypothetical protein n=1 Tax=Paractinoplanes durhamensis TaxID=113563 RepID=UPI00363336A2